MKILIVDDSKAMRLIVRKTLREAGYGAHELQEATNGAEALALIEASRPDLVLADWNMPEMTGIELLRRLKELKIAVKFGFVTSEGTADMVSEAMTTGALFLIVKPFTSDDFQRHLDPILKGG